MSGLLRNVRRLMSTGPVRVAAVVGPPVPGPDEWVSTLSRLGRAAAERVAELPGTALRAATARVDHEDRRHVWSVPGRAQIEVGERTHAPTAEMTYSVEDALKRLDGVEWARVDAVTSRAVVRFDPARLTVEDLVETIADVEATVGEAGPPVPRVDFPGDSAAVRAEGWALAADLLGLSAAVAGRLVRLPALPGSVAAAAVLVDNQPRLRGLLEIRLGTPMTDLVLAAANATALALTQGSASLAVDAGQRTQAVLAARARRAAFTAREGELWQEDRPGRLSPLEGGDRPAPLPTGPIERYADRAAAGSLLAAGGLLALTRSLDVAGRAVLVGAPKAARAAREAFADTLTRGLSGRGGLIMDPHALRVLDRVDTVLIDSAVLHDEQPLIVSARAVADHWTVEHVWSAAQRLLCRMEPLPIPPPPGRRRHRLMLRPLRREDSSGLTTWQLLEDGALVGEATAGTELNPLADAVLSAAQAAGLRVVVTEDPAAPELTGRADEVLARSADPRPELRRLQAAGRVVAVVAAGEELLAAADLGIGIVPRTGRVPWAADVLLGPGLEEVPRLLTAAARARAVSAHGVTLAMAGAFLGALTGAVGGPGRSSRATLPVTLATAAAVLDGSLTARGVNRRPTPAPVLHTPWHALEPDEVLARQPEPRLDAGGGAAARDDVRRSVWSGIPLLARTIGVELADPLTPVLATGAASSALIGSPVDALLVGGVLAGNAVVSGAQRLRAEWALRRLLADQQLTARLVGDDGSGMRSAIEVPARGLQSGDVIELHPGDVVPADGRLLEVDDLELDEASLTGEPVVIEKQTGATPGAELPDRACMVYEGTTVLAGTARVVVVATGAATEAGRALALAGDEGPTAGMQGRLEELTRRGLPIALLGGAAVAGLALLRGQHLRSAVGSGVSVAVAAVPEGLPLVATVAQSSAARRLSARGVLVRSARTVEALGRVDTVCFDKTGTLTEGRLQVVRLAGVGREWAAETAEGRRILRAAALASPRLDGRPPAHATDQTILDAARNVLADELDARWEDLSELPFQSDRGYSATVGRRGDGVRLVAKGAPEVIVPRCTHLRDEAGQRGLDPFERERALATVHDLASQGLRVLAVASRIVGDVPRRSGPDGAAPDPEELTENLTLLGFVALADTPRPEAAPTIAALKNAGLMPVMITGDHPVTARAIASDLGIPAAHVVTGPEFARADEALRTELVTRASVFARVSPEQKLRIVAALRRAGRVVAMIGDGANDAAAIRLADVGIGMAARGSISARSAADLVLTEPDVSLLLDALVEGRAMWRRVRDAVAILLGGNAGEVGFTLVGTALAGRAPLRTRQFLLVNMLTDLLPAMAIALAPTPEQHVQREHLLTERVPSLAAPLLRDIAIRGVATGTGALLAWQIGRFTGTRRRAGTMALAALVGTQLGQTLLVGHGDPLVLGTGLGSTAVLVVLIQTPGLSQFFGCTPLGPVAWATVTACCVATTVLAAAGDRLLPVADAADAATGGAMQLSRKPRTTVPPEPSPRGPSTQLTRPPTEEHR